MHSCYICRSSQYILYTIYSHVMVCMSMQSTQLNYNVDSNAKSSNYSKITVNFELDPSKIYFELVLLRINCVRINHAF